MHLAKLHTILYKWMCQRLRRNFSAPYFLIGTVSSVLTNDSQFLLWKYSGPCNGRPPLLRSLGGLWWGYSVMSRCKMYQKYYFVRIRGGHIRHVGLSTGGLSSQGPLYVTVQFYRCLNCINFSISGNK